MEQYEQDRKYRKLNTEYLEIIGEVKKNREETKKIVAKRKSLDNTIWEANNALRDAHSIENASEREMAVQYTQEELKKAEEAIYKADLRYDEAKNELEQLKKEISLILNKVKHDKGASLKIDAALLRRYNQELTVKTKRRESVADFNVKLKKIQEVLSGEVVSVEEDGHSIHQEYDLTMTVIASLTDMIDYYEDQAKKLTCDSKLEINDEKVEVWKKKSQEEVEDDLRNASLLQEQEVRPRRIERAKARAKIAEIVSMEAKKVDLDPRDLEGIHSVEEMLKKREELKQETNELDVEIDGYQRLIKQLERRIRGGIGRNIALFLRGKNNAIISGVASSATKEAQNQLKEPEDTEEERFTYKYKVTQRELNRRYNSGMGIKDYITEHAYQGEDDD